MEEKLRTVIGREIVGIEKLYLFNNTFGTTVDELISNSIVYYIDSVSCVECLITRSMPAWISLSNELKETNYNLVIIFRTQDVPLIENIFNRFSFEIPYLIDFDGNFKKNNQINERILHTFLLSQKVITIVGDPENNLKLKKIYNQQIVKTAPMSNISP